MRGDFLAKQIDFEFCLGWYVWCIGMVHGYELKNDLVGWQICSQGSQFTAATPLETQKIYVSKNNNLMIEHSETTFPQIQRAWEKFAFHFQEGIFLSSSLSFGFG